MKALTLMVALHIMALICQAKLRITQTSEPCSWTVTSSGQYESEGVFAKADLHILVPSVCKALGCGEVYKLNDSAAPPNASCLADCTYHNLELINCSRTAGGECRILSQVICATPYITPTLDPCVWNLTSPESAEPGVAVPGESVHSLLSEICTSLGCGEVFPEQSSKPTDVCLTNCIYHNYRLWNCSAVRRSDCSLLSQIVCGNQVVRLTGGSHRCAGRVELWRGGQWGTVCDDEWDTKDAGVVCAQLGCGYAISVTGQGDPYSLGTGPIHLDELNCTGQERNLWECPAVTGEHDCGHKEDAGVVCSEYKALRLTGGLDQCSGRVEIHRNGSWGTVCDVCWYKEESSMACTMLGCGGVKMFRDFDEPFSHKNGTLWFYMCETKNINLWQCKEFHDIPHFCQDSHAAGVICENSLGLPMPTTSNPTTLSITTGQINIASTWIWSLELLGCIALSCILLIALTINFILCYLIQRKRKGHTVQQQFSNLQNAAETIENNYRDSIHLVKITSNSSEPLAQPGPLMWTQSSVDSGSYDTDYEASDSGPDTAFPLSTFHNSVRYSGGGQTRATKGIHLQSVTEEGPGYPVQECFTHHSSTSAAQGLTAATSADSFDSSSTSSGEWYENTGQGAADVNMENDGNPAGSGSVLQTRTLECSVPTSETENFLEQTDNTCQDPSNGILSKHNQVPITRQTSGDDSPIYSPVTNDSQLFSSDSDYDDIDNLDIRATVSELVKSVSAQPLAYIFQGENTLKIRESIEIQ